MEPELLEIDGYRFREGGVLFLSCKWKTGEDGEIVRANHAVSTLLLNPRYERLVREAVVKTGA
eukprot:6213694-Pleurochrysis_carterae.AAC.1